MIKRKWWEKLDVYYLGVFDFLFLCLYDFIVRLSHKQN